jgi:predicted site-specific integrase-resolvase
LPAARKPIAEPEPERGTPAQAAARANVSVSTIYRWIGAGKVRVEREGLNPRTYVRLDDIDRMLRDAAAA